MGSKDGSAGRFEHVCKFEKRGGAGGERSWRRGREGKRAEEAGTAQQSLTSLGSEKQRFSAVQWQQRITRTSQNEPKRRGAQEEERKRFISFRRR